MVFAVQSVEENTYNQVSDRKLKANCINQCLSELDISIPPNTSAQMVDVIEDFVAETANTEAVCNNYDFCDFSNAKTAGWGDSKRYGLSDKSSEGGDVQAEKRLKSAITLDME